MNQVLQPPPLYLRNELKLSGDFVDLVVRPDALAPYSQTAPKILLRTFLSLPYSKIIEKVKLSRCLTN
jgi:hypothetical protein